MMGLIIMSFPKLRLAPHLGRWGMFCCGIRYQVLVFSAFFLLKYMYLVLG